MWKHAYLRACDDVEHWKKQAAEKDFTIKTLNEEWKSRCDYLESQLEEYRTANAKLLSGLADNMENINRYQIAEDLLREVLPVLDRNQINWTLKRKINAVLQPNISVERP